MCSVLLLADELLLVRVWVFCRFFWVQLCVTYYLGFCEIFYFFCEFLYFVDFFVSFCFFVHHHYHHYLHFHHHYCMLEVPSDGLEAWEILLRVEVLEPGSTGLDWTGPPLGVREPM